MRSLTTLIAIVALLAAPAGLAVPEDLNATLCETLPAPAPEALECGPLAWIYTHPAGAVASGPAWVQGTPIASNAPLGLVHVLTTHPYDDDESPTGSWSDLLLVTADATTGAHAWSVQFGWEEWDIAGAMAATHDGARIVAAGGQQSAGWDDGVILAGFEAATGDALWSLRLDERNEITHLAAHPHLPVVYAATEYWGGASMIGHVLALDADTGAPLWERHIDASTRDDFLQTVHVAPDGSALYVSGVTYDHDSRIELHHMALDAATGATIWSAVDGSPQHDYDTATALSPAGDRLYTSYYHSSHSDPSRWLVARDAATGAPLWTAGPLPDDLDARMIAVSGDGAHVALAGTLDSFDLYAAGFRATDGAQVWTRSHAGEPLSSEATAIVAEASTGLFYLVSQESGPGFDYDWVTRALDPATGASVWTARYDSQLSDREAGATVAPGPRLLLGGELGGTVGIVAYDL